MNILAINFNHDGSAVLLKHGEIAGFVCTERKSRIKKHPGIRVDEVVDVLDQARLALKEVDLVLLLNLNSIDSPDVPKLYGSNLKETWPDFWINNQFSKVRLLGEEIPCVLSKEHHRHHAALAAVFSGFESGVALACDPTGALAYFFSPNGYFTQTARFNLVSSRVYAHASEYMFGSSLIGAGKLMGLAPYAKCNPKSLDYEKATAMSHRDAFAYLLEVAHETPSIVLEGDKGYNASIAAYAQHFLELELTNTLEQLAEATFARGLEPNLCLSGGIALNAAANEFCFSQSRFKNLYLHPASGDDGTSIGAALAEWHLKQGNRLRRRSHREAMYGVRSYDHTVEEELKRFRDRITIQPYESLREVATLIADGHVIGWFHGPSEIGPRALGNRSILADPRSPTIRDYINTAIKQRELFRPFAPAILFEHCERTFGLRESPFMLRIAKVRDPNLPSITHVDGTSRPQSVRTEDNPRFYELISEFFTLTGVPMVLNTSFNGKGEPIVETPRDAINCMLRCRLDGVVFPGLIVRSK